MSGSGILTFFCFSIVDFSTAGYLGFFASWESYFWTDGLGLGEGFTITGGGRLIFFSKSSIVTFGL